MKQGTLPLTAAIVLIALAAPGIMGCNLAKPSVVGKAAPDFNLPLLGGGEMNLAQHAGKDLVVLDFWATWCPPCRKGLPDIAALADKYADAPVAVYAVNLGEPAELVSGFLREAGIEIPVALDITREVGARYEVQSIPTTLLIDRDGMVHYGHIGHSSGLQSKLSAAIDKLLSN